MSLLNNSNAIPTKGGDYNLENSLRFRSSANAYLSRTPATAGNRQTLTYSCWFKLGSTELHLLETGNVSSTLAGIVSLTDGTIRIQDFVSSSQQYKLITAQVFRDPSSWYHLVFVLDTTNAISTDRLRLYINGSRVTSFSTEVYPALSYSGTLNTAEVTSIGSRSYNLSAYGDQYLTEINFVDGQALTASDFGETNETTGVWQPIEYTSTYGTNGFYLPFNDASSVAALGFDNSGNSNNWTPNNISVYGGTSTSFSTVGTTSWTAPAGVTSIKYLVVAGGGGGGSATTGVNMGGGGGAGGLLQGTLEVTPGSSYTVTIGSGGAANTNGGDSVLGTITATGGGYGARNVVGSTAPSNGGSGGGASAYASNPGSGIAGQGFSGGTSAGSNTAAGGGGSSEVGGSVSGGTVGGKGGDGTNLSISGSSVTYAGGGGGGAYSGETGGAGGSGGGGAGGSNATDGANATGYGSGGGGAGQYGNTRIGGSGSSGIVVISYGNSSTYDSMTDVPTLTDEDTANYAVFNPLMPTSVSNTTFTDGNLKIVPGGNQASYYGLGTIGLKSGKWYFESQGNRAGTGTSFRIGFSKNQGVANADIAIYNATGNYEIEGTTITGKATYTNGDIIGTAVDLDSNTIEFFKNNTSQGSVSFSSGEWYPHARIYASSSYTTNNIIFNFGQRPFAYTPPTGYLKLNTFNLPDSSIVDGSEHFVTALYTGTGSSRSIDNTITDGSNPQVETGDPIQFQPDLTWIKVKNSASYEQMWFDSVRGATKYLRSNGASTEGTVANSLTSFDSNGFSLGANGDVNGSTFPIVAWNWKAGGTAVSNTAGTITSSVSANPTAGFSVVTYSGTNSASTIGHGLGDAPKFIVVKTRSGTENWNIYHASLGNAGLLYLNLTNAAVNGVGTWNSTSPTSSVFSVTGNNLGVNQSGQTYVAYCFAEVEGFSKFGSYTGNGSADGTFVYTGFRPAYVMIKRTNATNFWYIYDTKRDAYNVMHSTLYANISDGEATASVILDSVSNGFKLRTALDGFNLSGSPYIYMAFAENPFKNSLAR